MVFDKNNREYQDLDILIDDFGTVSVYRYCYRDCIYKLVKPNAEDKIIDVSYLEQCRIIGNIKNYI